MTKLICYIIYMISLCKIVTYAVCLFRVFFQGIKTRVQELLYMELRDPLIRFRDLLL